MKQNKCKHNKIRKLFLLGFDSVYIIFKKDIFCRWVRKFDLYICCRNVLCYPLPGRTSRWQEKTRQIKVDIIKIKQVKGRGRESEDSLLLNKKEKWKIKEETGRKVGNTIGGGGDDDDGPFIVCGMYFIIGISNTITENQKRKMKSGWLNRSCISICCYIRGQGQTPAS